MAHEAPLRDAGGGAPAGHAPSPTTYPPEPPGVDAPAAGPAPVRSRAADVLLALALLAVLAFAPAAYVAARAVPVPAAARAWTSAFPVAPDQRADHPVRTLPAGLPPGLPTSSPADLEGVARAALGAAGAGTLLAVLAPATPRLQETAVGGRLGFAPYPYRYPAMTWLLDQAPGQGRTEQAATLGAALLALAAQPGGGDEGKFGNAAPAAYAVLDRARAAGSCPAQLNLLLLVSADNQPRDAPVRDEARRAEAACPDDPTPGWLLGQFQSQRAATPPDDAGLIGDPIPADAQDQALATVERLRRRFPDSATVHSGLADAELRAGLQLQRRGQAFAGRRSLQAAADSYVEAARLGLPEAGVGFARALIALGEPARAAALLRDSITVKSASGLQIEALVTAEEAAHEFGRVESTARQFARRGAAAYPRGGPLFAVPQGDLSNAPAYQDARGPQSMGTAAAATFTVGLQPPPGGAGAVVEDVSFIPAFRADPSLTGWDPSCPEGTWRRAAVLAGHPMAALADYPPGQYPEFREVRPTRDVGCWISAGRVREIGRLEAGLNVTTYESLDEAMDQRQNLWRWAGDLPHAQRATEAWAQKRPTAPLPLVRLGEIHFLRQRYDDAAEAFGAAARLTRQARYDNDLGYAEEQLGRGASLLRAGRRGEGQQVLRGIAENSEQGTAYHRPDADPDAYRRFAAVAYHARAQLADDERLSGNVHAAIEDYEAARAMLPALDRAYSTGMRPERLYANQAVTELSLGRVAQAEATIGGALRADPQNPAFLMTAGFAADRAGRIEAAARYDEQALASDPGAFPAANDLGVEQARLHQDDRAVAALRRAVGARADYALGWFNLGVVYARTGPTGAVLSQGAFARAFQLDPALRDRARELTIDARTYRTGLDLSRPLPARWSFAQVQNLAPAPSAGLLAMVLLGLALARTAAAGSHADALRGWLESTVDRLERLPGLSRLRHPAWGIAVTLLVLTVPAVLHGLRRASDVGLFAAGVLVLCLVALRCRAIVARRAGQPVRNESWAPGLAFGAAAAVVAPWTPLPVARTGRDAPRVHAAAPVTLALIGVVLFVESAALGLPATRALAEAALIMVASMLLPIGPLDGAKIGKSGLLAAAGVLGAALLLALGII